MNNPPCEAYNAGSNWLRVMLQIIRGLQKSKKFFWTEYLFTISNVFSLPEFKSVLSCSPARLDFVIAQGH